MMKLLSRILSIFDFIMKNIILMLISVGLLFAGKQLFGLEEDGINRHDEFYPYFSNKFARYLAFFPYLIMLLFKGIEFVLDTVTYILILNFTLLITPIAIYYAFFPTSVTVSLPGKQENKIYSIKQLSLYVPLKAKILFQYTICSEEIETWLEFIPSSIMKIFSYFVVSLLSPIILLSSLMNVIKNGITTSMMHLFINKSPMTDCNTINSSNTVAFDGPVQSTQQQGKPRTYPTNTTSVFSNPVACYEDDNCTQQQSKNSTT